MKKDSVKEKKQKSAKRQQMETAFLDWLKSMIFPLILVAILLIGVLVVINYHGATQLEEIIRINEYTGGDAPIVMENDKLRFVMDPLTTQFTLEVKETGKIWYSVPENGSEDSVAVGSEKGNLQSPLLMSYSQETGLETSFNCFDYSIKNKIYDVEVGADYVKVKYSMGSVEREYIIPPVAVKEDLDYWLSLMDANDASFVKGYYKLYDINNLGKNDNKDELLENYPILKDEVIYVLRDIKKASQVRVESILESVGYTVEDYAAAKALDLSEKTTEKPIFNVDVIYRLEGGDMVVEIPFSSLEYRSEYPMYTVSPLPYFGAGGVEDEGFLLVPEGGGALINFNNGKNAQNSYYANVYGWDMALTRKEVVHNTRVYYNVFGVSQGDDSFLCIMEDGVSYASVRADISGRNNSYNNVNAIYSICSREKYDVGAIANSDIYVHLKTLPDESIVQRYRFVNSGSYVDMAKEYQSYLRNRYGSYLAKNTDGEAPVAVEILGAVDKVQQVLGVPVSRPLKLTTYKEAAEIIKELKSEGFNNMDVKFTGWCNGGVNQKLFNSVRLVSALGSSKDLKALSKAASDAGVDLYLNGVTQYAYDSNIFNGFFSFTDAAKLLTKERAELFVYSPVTYAAREYVDSYYLLHTDLAGKMADKLVQTAGKYGAGVSFQELGKDLSSDFYRKNPTSREAARRQHEDQFKAVSDSGQKLMFNMGNDYAAAYSDIVTNMELKGSEYTIIDEYIPFYQLALHGYVDYTGVPLNLAGETEEELLLSAEYGAGLYFSVMKETAFVLQKTLYTEYFGSDYSSWHDKMVETYTRYNRELGHTFNQEMTGHENITEELSCTAYEDGTLVYVNYGFMDATAPDGTIVPSRDYKVVRK